MISATLNAPKAGPELALSTNASSSRFVPLDSTWSTAIQVARVARDRVVPARADGVLLKCDVPTHHRRGIMPNFDTQRLIGNSA